MSRRDFEALERRIGSHLDCGDFAAAATEALEGYGRPILLYLRAVLQNEDAADEVFGQFAENLWKGIRGFRRESSFRTWAYRLAWNAAQNFQKDVYRNRSRRLRTPEVSKIVDRVRSATPYYLKSEAKERLAHLTERLEPEDRALLVLRLRKGLSWTEVAEAMSSEKETLTPAAVRMRFGRLKQRLREMAAAEKKKE